MMRALKVTYLIVFLLLIVYSGVLFVKMLALPEEKFAQVKVLPASSSQTPKKYFIPLGSASSKSLETWKDTGAQVYLDPADYPGAMITWEASFKIPTANGKVCARLINVNENIFLWGSEICSEGDTYKLISSGPITPWQGNKLYRVQLKTTMDYEAIMEGARIKVSY